ncbi:protein transport protein Sec16B isoform X2 [Denticeps clupeoides]|uniref:protein transport protein Sec16B isoform X2 n=1 Tax=Denticeps clupeoides TaxID=299321 RepID=UPI0010A49B24|nr:protein transport protein Sec16B-like isoform X2 [Denticeps clupeoides]
MGPHIRDPTPGSLVFRQGYDYTSYSSYWDHREDYRFDHRRDFTQYDDNRFDVEHTGRSEEVSLYAPGNLSDSKTSGLSSSSYELSQYMNAAEISDLLPESLAEPEFVPEALAPLKFSLPHGLVSFGPAGQLIRVSPSLGSNRDRALVEVHSLEVILGDTREQQELRHFPGPLSREDLHKVDVMSFALQRAEACLHDETLPDAASAALLWNLLVLLCRQNGRIVGSDIADLLTRDSHPLGDQGPSLIDLSDRPSPEREPLDTTDLLTGNAASCAPESEQEALQSYTRLLLAGRKKEALESAMKSGLWGHALFLASKMGSRSYSTVLNRFTGCLAPSDPLQTLFQLLSGRIPVVATSCGSDRWGDWKPHLAVMLSNETTDISTHHKAIVTMGDTLASRGMLHAAHICYITARTPFGAYMSRSERLVLLGSSHSLPFLQFTHNMAIQCTEVFEYSQQLGQPTFIIPSFQVYKFLYACRLLDSGLTSQAFHYCEVVGKALLSEAEPCMVLLGELIKLTDKLKHSEAQLADTAADGTFQDPEWLLHLRCKQQGIQMVSNVHPDTCQPPEEGAVASEENFMSSELNQYDLCSSGVNGIHTQGSYLSNSHHEGAAEQQCLQVSAPQVPEVALNQPFIPGYSHPIMPAGANHEMFDTKSLSKAAGQDPGFQDFHIGSYYQMTDMGLYSTAHLTEGQGLDLPPGQDVMNATVSGTISEADDLTSRGQDLATKEEQSSTRSVKSSKLGWFSSWFQSKPKDSQQELSDSTPPSSPEKEAFPSPPHHAPIGMIPPKSSPAGINPFSRKAGQQLSPLVHPAHGSLAQGP